MLKEIELKKKVKIFYTEEINSETIDSVIEFCKSQKDEDILLDSIKIKLSNCEPHRIEIGINCGGSVGNYSIEKGKFYIFRGNSLEKYDNETDIKLEF